MEEVNRVASNSARLLQEMDLIAKGFVLIQGSGATTFSPYEEPPQSKNLCAALNSTLTSTAQVFFSMHRLLEHKVLHYPIIKGLFEEAPPLKESCSFTERMQYLKKRVAVMKLQLSAVLTELLGWLSNPEEFCEYKIVLSRLYSSYDQSDLPEKLNLLENHLMYNKCFWLKETQSRSEFQSIEKNKKNVYVAIHSLGLHMQAALYKVQSLETKFEKENDASQVPDSNCLEIFPDYEYVKGQLSALRCELESCQGCLEETEVRIDRKYGVSDDKILPKSNPTENNSDTEHCKLTNVAKPPPIVLYDLEEPVVEDEVFEAYIDQDYVGKEGDGNEEDFWNTDIRKERQMYRQQREQGKRVLRELQPILSNRRKMWEQREKIALEKSNVKTGQASAESSTHSEGEVKRGGVEGRHAVEKDQGIQVDFSSTQNSTSLSFVSALTHEEEEEIDSDEERLKVYRKIKQELDEDEEKRSLSQAEGNSLLSKDQSLVHGSLTNMNILASDSEDSDSGKVQYQGEVNIVSRFSLPIDRKLILRKKQNNGSTNELEHFQDGTEENSNTEDFNQRSGSVNTKRKFPFSETLYSASEEREVKPLSYKSTDESPKREEETFVHNEDLDTDEAIHIDWSSITLPARDTDSLDDRLHLYAGGSSLKFHAEIAAMATKASRTFAMASNNPVETFGGMGEGEEVFGTDSDQDDTDKEEE